MSRFYAWLLPIGIIRLTPNIGYLWLDRPPRGIRRAIYAEDWAW